MSKGGLKTTIPNLTSLGFITIASNYFYDRC